MENVLLIIHLIIALCLISVVLLQRSEGGALGIGGGGGGLVTSRGAETALSKFTWALAAAFIATSILLTILAGGREVGSVFDRLDAVEEGELLPLPDLEGDGAGLLPPAAEDTGAGEAPEPAAPATPPAAD